MPKALFYADFRVCPYERLHEGKGIAFRLEGLATFKNTQQGTGKARLERYYQEQARGERAVFVAVETNIVAGYVMLVLQARGGPLARR